MKKIEYYKKIMDSAPFLYLLGEITDSKKDVLIIWQNKKLKRRSLENNIGKNFIDTLDVIEKGLGTDAILECINNSKANAMLFIPFINCFCKIVMTLIASKYILIDLQKEYELEEVIFDKIIKRERTFIWTKIKDGRYINISEAYMEFYKKYIGVNSDNFIGKKESEILLVQEEGIFQKEEEKIIKGKCEKINVVKDICGRRLAVRLMPYMVNSSILGVIGVGVEISEKTTPTYKRKEKEAMLMQICDNIYDGVIFVDKELNIQYQNKITYEYIEEMKKNNILIENGRYEDNNILKVIESKEKNIDVISRKDENGKNKSLEVMKVPVFNNFGDVGGVCIVIRNVTERVENEFKAENERQDFFSNISHEFRTPLNLILTAIQLIKYVSKDSRNYEEYEKYFNIINSNCFRLLKYVNMIINVTKLDIGEIAFNPKVRDIVSQIEDIFENMIEYAKSKKIEMIFDTDFEEKLLYYDEEKMEVIISNLLTNAIKYNNDNGKITLSITQDNMNIRIKVSDNGIGIPKESLREIFEKFKQIRNDKTEINKGSGIGLYLVKTYTELHGGSVIVNSEIDKGTEFQVILPIK